jgi:hypothetical protein
VRIYLETSVFALQCGGIFGGMKATCVMRLRKRTETPHPHPDNVPTGPILKYAFTQSYKLYTVSRPTRQDETGHQGMQYLTHTHTHPQLGSVHYLQTTYTSLSQPQSHEKKARYMNIRTGSSERS